MSCEEASSDWLVDTERAIYCVVIAAVWQSAGFVMALFLAGLRSIDDAIIKAAQVPEKAPTLINPACPRLSSPRIPTVRFREIAITI